MEQYSISQASVSIGLDQQADYRSAAWDTGPGPRASGAGLVEVQGLFSVTGPEPAPGLPPACNTGAENTQVLLDWCSMTFHSLPLQSVLSLLGDGEWSSIVGARGYVNGLVRGAVRVYYAGREGMGVHVQISGDGCRQLEAEGVVDLWEVTLARWLDAGAQFSRVDWAMDDRAGLVDLAEVRRCVREGEAVSRWREAREQASRRLRDGMERAATVYFGSPQSRARLRIYDKAAEQRVEGHWVRVELQLRDDRAQEMVELLLLQGCAAVPRVVLGYLQFKVPGADSNRARWQTAAWWAAFLEQCEKLTLSTAPARRTVEQVGRWLLGIAPMISAYVMAEARRGRDVRDLVGDLLEQGSARWRQHHRDLVNSVAPALAAT